MAKVSIEKAAISPECYESYFPVTLCQICKHPSRCDCVCVCCGFKSCELCATWGKVYKKKCKKASNNNHLFINFTLK